ncbi:MAG: hypothetical protein ACE5JG_07385, partial [Planctomycetota bacterium]
GARLIPVRGLLLALIASGAPTLAQTEPEPVPHKEAKGAAPVPAADRLIAAVEGLRARQDLVASVRVAHRAAQRGGGGGAVQVFVSTSGGARKPFAGDLEVWVGPDDTMVLVSQKKMPGFGIYRSRDRTITRILYEGQPPGLSGLRDELGPLLELGRVLQWIRRDRDELEVETDAETGRTTLRGKAPKRLVRSGGAVGPMGVPTMKARVLRVEAKFVLDAAGGLAGAEFAVVHTDPFAALRRMGAGGAAVPGLPQPKAGGEREGGRAVYRLRFDRKRPSPRATEFRRTIETILTSDDE